MITIDEKIFAMKLALFDFDGTIISRDTLIDFIFYAYG